MFPLKDSIPSKRFPFVNYLIIITTVIVYLYEKSLGREIYKFYLEYGVIPLKIFMPHNIVSISEKITPFFTSIFIHGGFFHLLSNMYFLFVFGDNVEDYYGHFRYLLFYLGCGIFAAFIQVIMFPKSNIPMIGASGAVAGVMGSYLILFPHSKIKTLIFIIIFITIVDIPAVVFLVFWFIIQFINGTSQSLIGLSGGIAWWAHIAGFVLGLIYGVYKKYN